MSALLAFDVSNTHTGIAWWPGEVPPPPDAPDHGPGLGPSQGPGLGAGLGPGNGSGQVEGPPPHWQIASDPGRTPDELRVLLTRFLAESGLDRSEVGACVIACVVPESLAALVAACRRLFACEPLVVGPGVRSGLRIRTENPRELGADRIAGAIAATARYGSPVLVLDFSTALTVDVVGADGDYLGAIIAPGIEIAADALARRTARLRRFDLVPPDRAIADDTDAALRSGMVFGYLGLVEGLVARVHREIGPAPVIATGDAPWLPALLAHTRVVDAYDPLLTLDGLRRIYWRHSAG